MEPRVAERPRRAGVADRVACTASGTVASPHCSAYSRATSTALAASGTTRSSTPAGPCTLTARLFAAVPCTDATTGLPVRAFRCRDGRFGRRRQGSRSIGPRLCSGPRSTTGGMLSTTLRGTRLDEPEMPSGQIVLQAPPQIERDEGAAGVLMNAIPMLGSLGSIVLVATMGQSTGGRSYVAAGMFLFATLGFIVVQLDRQRKQRAQQVTGSRTEYLRYLGNVRQVARRGRGPAAPRPELAPPRPRRPAVAGGGTVPGLGARQQRRRLPPRPVRRLLRSRSRWSWCRRRAPRSTRSTRPPRRRCTACSSCTACSRSCRPASTCAPSTGSSCAVGRPGALAGPLDDLLRRRPSTPPTTSWWRSSAPSRTSCTGTG